MRKVRQSGFTLIELMITVAIVAVLAAIAYPSYTSHIQKGARRAAQAQMLDIANREQQYLLANRVYATKAQLVSTGYNLPAEVSDRYGWDITVGSSTVPSYTITFAPISGGPQESDGTLSFNSEGVKAPDGKW